MDREHKCGNQQNVQQKECVTKLEATDSTTISVEKSTSPKPTLKPTTTQKDSGSCQWQRKERMTQQNSVVTSCTFQLQLRGARNLSMAGTQICDGSTALAASHRHHLLHPRAAVRCQSPFPIHAQQQQPLRMSSAPPTETFRFCQHLQNLRHTPIRRNSDRSAKVC
jgi:hypothetical protein